MSAEKEEITVVVYRSTFTRWLSGATSLAVIVGTSIANHRWGGGTAWIDSLTVILGFTTLCALAMNTRRTSFAGTKQEAIDYLNKMH